MDIIVVQAFRFPNVFTARSEGDHIDQCFVDKFDPAGSFAAEACIKWAVENGHRITDVCLQPQFKDVPYGFMVKPTVLCEHTNLRFVGHIAAPGYGKAWECERCDEPMWGATADSAVPYRDLDGVPELSPEDVI
jgi:hypothetical protein